MTNEILSALSPEDREAVAPLVQHAGQARLQAEAAQRALDRVLALMEPRYAEPGVEFDSASFVFSRPAQGAE